MKKSYIPISDVNNEKNELTRRIYRAVTEVVRQLDDVRGRSQTVSDLFLPCLATQRVKLHELCYRLILTDPLGYGRKGEELLWRKGYHDVFTTAKRLRKNDTWSHIDVGYVQGLLISGIGHYQHLLLKLQTDYKLDFQGVIDFPLTINDLGLSKGKTSSSQQKVPDKNLVEWAKESCQRCLIYLGDLSRYLLDIYPLWDSGVAERYYLQAASMNNSSGRPHNQLGTLSGTRNFNLDAVYHYVRSLTCTESFQGAEANLKKALEKNSEFLQLEPFLPNPAPLVQKLITKFLLLFEIWYFEKDADRDLHDTCHEMLQELQVCLSEENFHPLPMDVNELELSNLTPFRDRTSTQPDFLSSDMVLKMILLVLFSIDKLQKKDSSQVSAAIAMCLAIFSQLLQQLIIQFQNFYARFGVNELRSNDSQKSYKSSNETQPKAEKFKKKNKFERIRVHENQTNGHSVKKSMKYSEKKRYKNKYQDKETENNGNGELSDLVIDDKETAEKAKKKSRLKRRKRVRQGNLDDLEHSDSDITINDSSSENEYPLCESESDEEVASSGSEDLDETLLIIDQKIKEKKIKDDEKTHEVNGVGKASKETNSDLTVVENEKEILSNGFVEQNGVKLTNEDEKTKSLFTISNGVHEEKQLAEKSGVNFLLDNSTLTNDMTNGNTTSGSISNESVSHRKPDGVNKKPDANLMAVNSRQVELTEMLQFLSQQQILKTIKVCMDWLKTDPEMIRTCSKSSKTLMSKIVVFLNLISFDEDVKLSDFKKARNKIEAIPLSEDIITRGLPMLRAGQENLDWDFHKTNRVSSGEENMLRLLRMVDFGHYLVSVTGNEIYYDKQRSMFSVAGQNGKTVNAAVNLNDNKQANNASRKGQLMKNMGQLWLKAEVRDLESRVRRRAGNFSPYLVVDSEALIEHIVLVKQLVGSRQFIVIIPAVVLSHLDECKRDSGRARETIRWLESQFQHGNRSLRAQKSQERFSLPLIKYPKKKDKEAWNFFQIVECCHYFSKQSEFQSSQSNLLVTLLTGQRDVSFAGDSKKEDYGKEYSPIGVAKNFGINLEHIETFHTKWKLSTKSHG